jgi:hypothetical protein
MLQFKDMTTKIMTTNYFNTLYLASFTNLHYDQQMHNYLTNYHTATCFDTIVSSSDTLPRYTNISNAAVGNTIYN